MNKKDYFQCSSALELVACAMQYAIISFLDREHLIASLEQGHYLYHSALNKALSGKATPQKVCHAFVEINRYCFDRSDSQGELLHFFYTEMSDAITAHGLRVHQLERQRHGRSFLTSNP